MKKTLLFASLTALLVPALAHAQDAGPEPETCDPETFVSACDGAVLTACNPETTEVVEIDCAEGFSDLGTATCAVVEGEATCVMGTGGVCLASSGGQLFNVPCGNASEGCGFTPGTQGWTCNAGAPSCTPPAEGAEFQPTCTNNSAVWGCNFAGQAIYDDCAAIGGTCDQGIFCINVEEGGLCDGAGAASEQGPFWPCAAGLVCQGLSDTSYGTCAPATGEGEGEGEGEGGEGEGEGENPRRDDEEQQPPPSGGCLGNAAMNSAVPPSLGLLALLGVLAVRRRRR